MAEYIDIDAPIDVAVYQRNRRIQVTLRQILESNDAKYRAADVRPVVTCADCKHNNACLTQAFVEDESKVPFDRNIFFCADGKRADDA